MTAGIDKASSLSPRPCACVRGCGGQALAGDANDQLSLACRRHPERFIGMTAIAPQDPAWSAKEIERGHTLGFKAVIHNGHVGGEYTDDQKYWPIFEAAEALGTPVYLHPQGPSKGLIGPLLERGLDGAVYGFGVDTGLHLLPAHRHGRLRSLPTIEVHRRPWRRGIALLGYRLDYMHAAGIRSGRYEFLKPLKLPILRLLQAQYLCHLLGRSLGNPRSQFCKSHAGRGSHPVCHGLSLPVPSRGSGRSGTP